MTRAFPGNYAEELEQEMVSRSGDYALSVSEDWWQPMYPGEEWSYFAYVPSACPLEVMVIFDEKQKPDFEAVLFDQDGEELVRETLALTPSGDLRADARVVQRAVDAFLRRQGRHLQAAGCDKPVSKTDRIFKVFNPGKVKRRLMR